MSSTADMGERRNQKFGKDASEVLSELRGRVAEVLSELGTFKGPAEVQRALQLDKTLGRQVFRLACAAESLGGGGTVPSRTSMGRFIEAAKSRGIPGDSLQGVWSAYEVFEKLIETHAGDRSTFNSMVSAASGTDDEWFAADAQHRRNAFRAMSHTLGLQAKTNLHLSIVGPRDAGGLFSMANISGLYGLRVLRPLPQVRVFGHLIANAKAANDILREPIGLSDLADGHLIEPFSSSPLPNIVVSTGDTHAGQRREVFLDHPEIGNTGTCNLVFGTVLRRVPSADQTLNFRAVCTRPVEVLMFDVLMKPGEMDAGDPTGHATLGADESVGPEVVTLKGKFKPERLGRGPRALATPEVPRYKQLLEAIGGKLGWDLDAFEAWRIRAEFPIYRSTITMGWPNPSATK